MGNRGNEKTKKENILQQKSRYGFLVAAILLFFFDFFNGTSQTYKNVKHVL
nr:MAG TPA: hypothetical protein [Caudoviricetes sp.]